MFLKNKTNRHHTIFGLDVSKPTPNLMCAGADEALV